MGRGSQTLLTLAGWLRRRKGLAAPVAVARTHVGKVRTINEDRVLDRTDAGLWAIADGMGGMHAGDVAAQAVVDALAALDPVDEGRIVDATARANAAIHTAGQGRSGATIVAAFVVGQEATILWAGDSRCYHVRGSVVRRVTRDHSLVQDMVDAGLLKAEEAEHHPRANVITRAVGVATTVVLDTVRVALVPGDRLLLCSDGVSRSLELRDVARRESVEALADRLLAGALERDGSDNASLVVIAV